LLLHVLLLGSGRQTERPALFGMTHKGEEWFKESDADRK
jgi:hypothetical protein